MANSTLIWSLFLLSFHVYPICAQDNIILTGGALAGIIIGCICATFIVTALVTVSILWRFRNKHVRDKTHNEVDERALRMDNISTGTEKARQSNNEVTNQYRIPVKGKKLTDLGFDIYGNHRDGLFVKNLAADTISSNGAIKDGDKIISVELNFDRLSFIDSFALLDRLSSYTDVLTLILQKGPAKSTDAMISLKMFDSPKASPLMKISRSYGSYRKKYSRGERKGVTFRSSTDVKTQLRRGDDSKYDNQAGPQSVHHSLSKFVPQVLLHDDFSTDNKCVEMYDKLTGAEKMQLMNLSFNPAEKTQSTPDLSIIAPTSDTVSNNESTSKNDDRNEIQAIIHQGVGQMSVIDQPKVKNSTSTAQADETIKHDGLRNDHLMIKCDYESPSFRYYGLHHYPASFYCAPEPDYKSLRDLEDRYNIDIEDYEKLAYFDQLLIAKNKNLVRMGIALPPLPIVHSSLRSSNA